MRTRLSNSDVIALTAFRQALHRAPEVSGAEAGTARAVVAELMKSRPDRLLTGLGGHGVAAIWEGAEPGPTVLIRCELDALPILETGTVAHRSDVPGKAHLCGHDGHMAIVAGVARGLARQKPRRGRAVLLFQPAEEDGSGAAAVIADPAFAQIRPDLALSLHNYPGLALGQAVVRPGPANCASRGIRIRLTGRTAHAAQPETGLSPGPALAQLIARLPGLGKGGPVTDPAFSLVTVTHARLGEPAFGIAPAEAELWATLRTQTDAGMAALVAATEAAVAEAAERLGTSLLYHDIFTACTNAPEAVAVLRAALAAEAIPEGDTEVPMRASEDFGRFGALAPAAMLLLGAGEASPSLHNSDYDFPDSLIPVGAALFLRCLADQLG
ncbi:amidohydrolase [Rhodobacter capsulatus]|uniref:amidohydrolase n=1 Tax=Rhodobacter capsulatus TaxID=1061 RepID=UPI0003D2DB16|nr:amidohydrolase [Rhodobacter capsulatus]ETD02679.1 peptidase M20 [Rhodobacter capsulatus DE442]ETD78835.1 peptidase M20 [Rhodobacter capsulatus R121]ETE54814.1 peptidase M20 [Rhodobacter capsulatus Y262]